MMILGCCILLMHWSEHLRPYALANLTLCLQGSMTLPLYPGPCRMAFHEDESTCYTMLNNVSITWFWILTFTLIHRTSPSLQQCIEILHSSQIYYRLVLTSLQLLGNVFLGFKSCNLWWGFLGSYSRVSSLSSYVVAKPSSRVETSHYLISIHQPGPRTLSIWPTLHSSLLSRCALVL